MSRDNMSQSAVRLPRELHDKLVQNGAGRGMGAEIRHRLEASFQQDREAELWKRIAGVIANLSGMPREAYDYIVRVEREKQQ